MSIVPMPNPCSCQMCKRGIALQTEDEKRVGEAFAICDGSINKDVMLFIGFVDTADNEVGGGKLLVHGL